MRQEKLPNGFVVSCQNPYEVRFMWKEIFEGNIYLKHGLTIEPGNCVVDIGANVGMFSLWASEQAGDLRLHAVEPIPETFTALKTNLSHLKNVALHQKAIGGEEGETTMFYYPRMSVLSINASDRSSNYETVREWLAKSSKSAIIRWLARHPSLYAWTLRLAIGSAKQRVCPVTTLSGFMREQSIAIIDLLKIDVEGGETKLFEGIGAEEWPRIRQITLETDLNRLPAIRELLESNGFQVFDEQPEAMRHYPIRQVYAKRHLGLSAYPR
jgi:FkbM family methyltransferase